MAAYCALSSALAKGAVLRAIEASAQTGQHGFHISFEEGVWIEPKPLKDTALEQAVGRCRQFLVLPFAQFPPEDAFLTRNPGEVLVNAVPALGALHLVQIVGAGTADDLDSELRRAFNVIVRGNLCLPAVAGEFDQDQVGLRLVVQIQAHR